MKLIEIFRQLDLLENENHIQNMVSFILDLIISLKSQDITEINLDQFLKEIIKKGYDVDKKFLIDLLMSTNLVEKVESNKIFFKKEEIDNRTISKDLEKSHSEKVKKLASKAIKRRSKEK